MTAIAFVDASVVGMHFYVSMSVEGEQVGLLSTAEGHSHFSIESCLKISWFASASAALFAGPFCLRQSSTFVGMAARIVAQKNATTAESVRAGVTWTRSGIAAACVALGVRSSKLRQTEGACMERLLCSGSNTCSELRHLAYCSVALAGSTSGT